MEQSRRKTLSAEQIKQYELDGFLGPISVLSPEEVLHYRSALEDLESCSGKPLSYMAWSHLFFRWSYDLATHTAVVDAAEDILGPDVLVNSTLILCKQPHDASCVPWHQDGARSGLNKTRTVSAWIALSDSTSENGCMQVIPGSHKRGVLAHSAVNSPSSLIRNPAQVEVDERQARGISLAAGEMSLHHTHIIHGSKANQSPTKRIGYIIRFVTSERIANTSIRVKGYAGCRPVKSWPRPKSGNTAENIARWEEFVKQE